MNLRKNDTVLVLVGKDKGKRGRIFRVDPSGQAALVEGINTIRRSMRPKPNVRQAGIIQREAPINISNLKLICPSCDKPSRVLIQRGTEKGRKTRICKACQSVIE